MSDSPTDGEDIIYTCKGCGEVRVANPPVRLATPLLTLRLTTQILEEGKAFELGMLPPV